MVLCVHDLTLTNQQEISELISPVPNVNRNIVAFAYQQYPNFIIYFGINLIIAFPAFTFMVKVFSV